jgi:hypothetical protein
MRKNSQGPTVGPSTDGAGTCQARLDDFTGIFEHQRNFNEDTSAWDVSNDTTMRQMFCRALSFNQDLLSWDTRNVTVMSKMYVFVCRCVQRKYFLLEHKQCGSHAGHVLGREIL